MVDPTIVSSSFAQTLNFDDFSLSNGGETRINNGYGGFRWIQAGVYRPDGGIPGYVASSGSTLAFIAEAQNNEVTGYEDVAAGTPLTIIRDTPFALTSADFVAAFRDDLTITVRAYADAAGTQLIGSKTFVANLGAPALQSFTDGLDSGTFFGATRIEFSANDGNNNTSDYFGLDNLSFTTLVEQTIDFESFTLSPGGETRLFETGGFSFGETGVYRPDGRIPGYAASSGTNIGFIAEANGSEINGYEDAAAGSPVVITNSDTFAFLGGSFSAAFRDGLTVTVRGYADLAGTELVATQAITFNGGTAQAFDFSGFAGLQRLEFDSNDGNAATSDYFGFDDLRFLVPGAASLSEPLIG
ncbi:hypothetical protein IP88_15765 [alpha proteobacterium AAP81b]|nr:hypothetical protein IP88_15765 [alpha proteobacterium AAP81b]